MCAKERTRRGEETNEIETTRYRTVVRRMKRDNVTERKRRSAGVARSGCTRARETKRYRNRGAAACARPERLDKRRASIGALAVTPTMVLSLSPNGASLSRSPAFGATAAGTLSSPASLSDWCTLRVSERFSSWCSAVSSGEQKKRENGKRGVGETASVSCVNVCARPFFL